MTRVRRPFGIPAALVQIVWVLAWLAGPGDPVLAVSSVAGEDDVFQIVITASRLPQALLEAPVSVEVIGREEIVAAGARDLAEAVRLASGVTMISYGTPAAAQQALIRGSTSQQVLVLVDGLPVASPQGALSLAQFPVGMVERIEVLKGPASNLYGADALGGVINIVTAPAALAPPGRLSVRAGAAEVEVDALAAAVAGNARVSVAGGYARGEGWRPNSDYEKGHLWLRLDREVSSAWEGSFRLSGFESESGVPGSTTFPTEGRQHDAQLRAELALAGDDARGEYLASLYLRRFLRHYEDLFQESHHDATTVGGELQRNFFLERGSATIGVSVRIDRAVSTALEGGEASALAGALYGQLLHHVNSRMTLTVGARLDAHSAYRAPISPRAGLHIDLRPGTALRVSVGRAFRAPTFDDLYWLGAGNPDLEPEIGWSYELGVRQVLSEAAVDVALFRRETHNLIRWTPDAGGVWRPHNVAESRIDGVDVSLTIPVGTNVTLTGAWTAMDARDGQSGERLHFIPIHEGRVGLTYAAAGRQGHITLHYRGARPSPAGTDLSPYAVVNARFSWSVGARGEVYVEGRNLFDTDYEEAEGYPMPGRTLHAGVTYSF